MVIVRNDEAAGICLSNMVLLRLTFQVVRAAVMEVGRCPVARQEHAACLSTALSHQDRLDGRNRP